jgi:hypothetical protein
MKSRSMPSLKPPENDQPSASKVVQPVPHRRLLHLLHVALAGIHVFARDDDDPAVPFQIPRPGDPAVVLFLRETGNVDGARRREPSPAEAVRDRDERRRTDERAHDEIRPPVTVRVFDARNRHVPPGRSAHG